MLKVNNMRNMFKVNNEDTRKKSFDVVLVPLLILNIFRTRFYTE